MCTCPVLTKPAASNCCKAFRATEPDPFRNRDFLYPRRFLPPYLIVNVFVPSGGGQWAVQGPIVIESAHNLGVPLNKSIMALSYGDQLTNMLQPFWALPLLAITQLKAKQILPYTLGLMAVGAVIFIMGLLLF